MVKGMTVTTLDRQGLASRMYCRTCGFLFTGRLRKPCQTHLATIRCQDIAIAAIESLL
jgi:hypothetical protein